MFMYGAGKASYTVSRLGHWKGVMYCRALLWRAYKPALYSVTIKTQLVVLALIIVITIIEVCDNVRNYISILTTKLSRLSRISRYPLSHLQKVIVSHISAVRTQ